MMDNASEIFSYKTMITRNAGFINADEQGKLRNARVFIPGIGGMGGAAFMAMLRAGIGNFIIADLDGFEISNLNRQLFCNLDTVNIHKAVAAKAQALKINPEVNIEVYHCDWTENLEEIATKSDIFVNGMDDAAAGVHLYRIAKKHGLKVIDAYASPLPSVTMVCPEDPRPEERLNYPTIGIDWKNITREMRNECLMREIEYVLVNSNSHKYVDLEIAAEVAAGKRSRFSFSTMVTMAGTMMAEEAIRQILGRAGGADYRGYFFNTHTTKTERPLSPLLANIKLYFVRKFLNKLIGE